MNFVDVKPVLLSEGVGAEHRIRRMSAARDVCEQNIARRRQGFVTETCTVYS